MRIAPQVGAVACRANQLVIAHDGPPPQDRLDRPAFESPAVVNAVVGVGTELGGIDHAFFVQVDEGQVGVATDAHGTLAVIDIEDVGGLGGHQAADALQRQTPLMVALVQQHGQDGCGAGEPLRREPEGLVLGGALARAVVRGDDIDAAIGKRCPEGFAVVDTAKGWVGLAHAPQIHVAGMREVMRTGFDKNAVVAAAPAPDFLKTHGRAHVRDVDGGAELFGEEHRADAVFGLGDRGLDQLPFFQGVDAFDELRVAQPVDDLDVFGVADDGQPTDGGCGGEQFVQVAVVSAVQSQVPAFLALEVHEVFERGDAVPAHVVGEVLQVIFACGAEMEPVVYVRARSGVCLLALEDIVIAFVVQEEGEDGREAAERRVRGFGGVLGDLFPEAKVHVGVDQAREHVQTVDVALCHVAGDGGAGCHQRSDFAVLAEDVQGLRWGVGADDNATAQHERCLHGRIG